MRVVVTGAAGDPTCSQPLSIGAAAAIELARSADAMWLIDRNGPGLRWTKEQLPAAIDAELVECDLRDPAQLEAALAGVVSDDVGVYVSSIAGATAVPPTTCPRGLATCLPSAGSVNGGHRLRHRLSRLAERRLHHRTDAQRQRRNGDHVTATRGKAGAPMDTVLRNGLVVDGTGGPGVVTDVGIAGGRIAVIGDLSDESAGRHFDLAGLVLAPGFIDIHTHYDAQVLWDPDLTPSSWHGITSVVMGNCGFGVAPLRAVDSELLRDVLCTVEGMPPATVEAIVGQDFPTVAAYLEVVERRRPRLNVGVLVGHSALRVYSMGASALDRSAREAEMDEMASALRAAMDGGALGLATSRLARPSRASGPAGAEPAGRPRRVGAVGDRPGRRRTRGHPGHSWT